MERLKGAVLLDNDVELELLVHEVRRGGDWSAFATSILPYVYNLFAM